MLAPVALVVFGLAFIIVVASSGGGDDSSKPKASAAEKARDLGTSTTGSRSSSGSKASSTEKSSKSVYVVKRGDTLADISSKTGVSVDRLQELNPGLDQFSLVAGQRLKLR
jgi:LysM repeat protein